MSRPELELNPLARRAIPFITQIFTWVEWATFVAVFQYLHVAHASEMAHAIWFVLFTLLTLHIALVVNHQIMVRKDMEGSGGARFAAIAVAALLSVGVQFGFKAMIDEVVAGQRAAERAERTTAAGKLQGRPEPVAVPEAAERGPTGSP
jgi:hypothetical protein